MSTCMWTQFSASPRTSAKPKCVSLHAKFMEFICVNRLITHTRVCVYLRPYRLHLFRDGGKLLNFGPQFISLPVHHFLQPQHHLPLLPLDAVCTQTRTHTRRWVNFNNILGVMWTEIFPQREDYHQVSIVACFKQLAVKCVFYLRCQKV